MPLQIFLGDQELLYFIMRVEVIEIQIWFEFKLVCNLQKGLKIYRGFSNFRGYIGPNPGPGSASLLPRTDHSAQLASAGGSASYRARPTPLCNPTRLAQSDSIAH
jgi:hypothetical protein